MLATHEMTAVAMAHGYRQMADGRTGGLAFLHNLVGLMNGIPWLIIQRRFCDQVPMGFFGGSGPATPEAYVSFDVGPFSANIPMFDLVRPIFLYDGCD